MPHVVTPAGRQRKLGRQVQLGGEFLSQHTPSSARITACGVNQPPRRAPHSHAPPRPGSGGHSPLHKAHTHRQAHRPPSRTPRALLLPGTLGILLPPAGSTNLDAMDPLWTLGLWLLPLLLMGTAAQDPLGIAPARTPSALWLPPGPAAVARVPPTGSLPYFAQVPAAPVCTFSPRRGPLRRGNLSSPGKWLIFPLPDSLSLP